MTWLIHHPRLPVKNRVLNNNTNLETYMKITNIIQAIKDQEPIH